MCHPRLFYQPLSLAATQVLHASIGITEKVGAGCRLTDLDDVVHTALFHELGALAEGGVLHVVLPQRHLRHGRVHAYFKLFAGKRPIANAFLNWFRDAVVAFLNPLEGDG